MSAKRKVMENSFLYTFSALLVKAIGFLLLPFYTYYLSPEEYGTINLITSFIAILSIVSSLGLIASIIRYYSIYKNNKEKLKEFYGSIINFIFIVSGLLFVVLILANHFVMKHLIYSIDSFSLYLVAILLLLFNTFHSVHQGILQTIQKGRKLVVLNIIVFLAIVGLKILFVGVFHLGVMGFLLAQLFINVLYFFYMMIDLIKYNQYKLILKFNYIKEGLIYSLPLLPHNLSITIATFVSKLLIGVSSTVALIGIYSVSMQITAVVDLIQSSVYNAFKPWLFDILTNEKKDMNGEIVSLSNLLLYFYSTLYMGVALFSQELVIIMTDQRYWMAWTVIPILMIGFSIKSIYYFYVNLIIFNLEGTRKLFIATVTGSFIDIFIAFILIPILGIYGAAIAFVIAKIVMTSLVVFIAQKYKVVDYNVLKMLSIIIPSLILSGIGLYFSYTSQLLSLSISNFIYKLSIMLLYLLFVWLVNKKVISYWFRDFISNKRIKTS